MNKYDVVGVVGEGAYGVVLKCKNKETGDLVAIKKFKESEDDEIIRKSIQREVKMLRQLRHPNVVQLKEVFKRKGRIYIVFEFIEHNLLEILEQRPSGLEGEYIKKVMYQVVKAIHFMHSQDIIHRDVKPENLLVSSNGEIKVCDFGFARVMPNKSNQLLTDYVATRWYRAPELLISQEDYGKPVDMWAIGCILGELTDGQPLFPGENEMDQLYLIQKLIGSMTESQKEIFNKNERFVGLKFPDFSKPETLERRYLGKISLKGMNFLKQLLKIDPKLRITSGAALQHNYFEGLFRPEDLYVGKEYEKPEKIDNESFQRSNNQFSDTAQDKANINSPNLIIENKIKNVRGFEIRSQENQYNYDISEHKSPDNQNSKTNYQLNKSIPKLKQKKKQPQSMGKLPKNLAGQNSQNHHGSSINNKGWTLQNFEIPLLQQLPTIHSNKIINPQKIIKPVMSNLLTKNNQVITDKQQNFNFTVSNTIKGK